MALKVTFLSFELLKIYIFTNCEINLPFLVRKKYSRVKPQNNEVCDVLPEKTKRPISLTQTNVGYAGGSLDIEKYRRLILIFNLSYSFASV
jgi:hypothetical protein